MKKVTPADLVVFQKFFADLLRLKAEVVVWQVSTVDGKRRIHRSVLTSFKTDQGRFHLQNKQGGSFDFTDGILFCWAEKDSVIFKSRSLDSGAEGMSLELPEELCFLEGSELTVVHGVIESADQEVWKVKSLGRTGHDQEIFAQGLAAMNADEEEKLFADKREAPRVRAKSGKRIVVCKAGDEDTALEHPLFDLSRGGLAFVSEVQDLFQKGDRVHVLEIEQKRLDSPLVGEVMSVRELDDGSGHKVGVKFVEEI